MRWIAIFEDNEGFDWVRKEHSSEHFGYLAANRDKIVIAGGLRAQRLASGTVEGSG